MHVSGRTDPNAARVLRSFEDDHTNTAQIQALTQALAIRAEPVRMDSQAKFAVLAAGRGDLLVRLLSAQNQGYREKIWDVAAGALVVEEAGGAVTDLDGRPLDFTAGRRLVNNRGIVASNGGLQAPVLAALKALGA
jgi:3'(2'), 5'-bisphosphate nucleotidase